MKKLIYAILLLFPVALFAACPVTVPEEYLVTFATPGWAVNGVIKNTIDAFDKSRASSTFVADFVDLTPAATGIVEYSGTGNASIDPVTCKLTGNLYVGEFYVPYRSVLNKAGIGAMVGVVESPAGKIGIVGRIEKTK